MTHSPARSAFLSVLFGLALACSIIFGLDRLGIAQAHPLDAPLLAVEWDDNSIESPDDLTGTLTTVTVTLTITDVRHIYIYQPISYTGSVPVPLVVALHGGGGSGRQMVENHADIRQAAERENFIAVYPDGQAADPSQPNRHFWANDATNTPFIDEHVIEYMLSNYSIDGNRIYFVAFSGGAQFLYKLAADPLVSQRIAGIGTVAGSIGYGPDCPSLIVNDPRLSGGKQMPAFLVQGKKDPRTPLAGGYDDEEVFNVSFRDKVDIWANHIGGQPAHTPSIPQTPTDIQSQLYVNNATGNAVLAVIDPALEHSWPDEWMATGNGQGMMGAFWDFFERYPAIGQMDRGLIISSSPTGCIYPGSEITFTLNYTNPEISAVTAQGVFTLPDTAALLNVDLLPGTGVVSSSFETHSNVIHWEATLDPGGIFQVDAAMQAGDCSGQELKRLTAEAAVQNGAPGTPEAAHFVDVWCGQHTPMQQIYLPLVQR